MVGETRHCNVSYICVCFACTYCRSGRVYLLQGGRPSLTGPHWHVHRHISSTHHNHTKSTLSCGSGSQGRHCCLLPLHCLLTSSESIEIIGTRLQKSSGFRGEISPCLLLPTEMPPSLFKPRSGASAVVIVVYLCKGQAGRAIPEFYNTKGQICKWDSHCKIS